MLTEIIEGIRERVGEDFIIQVLYSGFEGSVCDLGFDENFMTLEEACEFARLFEAAGASCLHIRSQAYGRHCGGFIPDGFHIHEHGETGYGSVIDYGKHFGGMVDGSHDGYGALIDVAAEIKKHVSIPVGCVGSMEAARIAAQRGHSVALVEKGDALGGRLPFVQALKGPHEKIMAHEQWLERQLALYGVNVVTGTEATADTVAAQNPDAVVVAVGAVAVRPDVAGIEGALTLDELAASAVEGQMLPVGDRVVIYGAQFQACELAVNLLKTGKRVTMVNPGPESDFFLNAPTWPRLTGKRWLAFKGLEAFHGVDDVVVSDGAVSFTTPTGTSKTVAFDTIVVATPLEKQRGIYDELVASGSYEEVYAVGDCYAPSTIANATARANVAARWIGREGANPLAAAETSELAGEVYAATASGIGDVTVTIGVEGGAIVDAAVDTSAETEGVGQGLGDVFAAQIVEQGAVDAVSGATVASSAVQAALADCLAQAGLA